MTEEKTDKGDAYEQSGNFGIGHMSGGIIQGNVAGVLIELCFTHNSHKL